MPVTVVVGAQYGSEGKGKLCAHLAASDDLDCVVRCGGPNSGHTVHVGGIRYELKQVPSGFVNPGARLLVAPGALVNPRIFLEEAMLCGLDPARLGVDENAGVIEEADIQKELALDLRGRLGSTGSGVGAAVSRRVLRESGFRRAKDHPDLAPFTTSVRRELAWALRGDGRILVEGAQGFGLSLYHARDWPYRTSRDTTAHSFLGEVGMGVRDFEVVMAVRIFPIRVAGDSGPLEHEVTWGEVQDRYAGDLGDFGKFGLLRALCALAGAFGGPPRSLGVVWYLVPDEVHNGDGKRVRYLVPSVENQECFRVCDPALYDALGDMGLSGRRGVALWDSLLRRPLEL